MREIRASIRAALGIATLPLFVGLTALQGFIVGPLTGNQTFLPTKFYNGLRRLFGFKVEFNKASAPLVKDRPVWYVANHQSIADFIVLGSALEGTFAGKGEILKWPAIAQMARAVKYIGLRRSSEFNGESRAKIINNFNAGHNTIMFPEATATDGKKLYLFRASLLKVLFGEKGVDAENNEVALQKDVVVQPIAIRVKTVSGQDAAGNEKLRDLYGMFNENNTLKRIWKRLKVRNVGLELTAFPPLDPKDFKDEKELINKAALDVASVVYPGQTVFEKAVIPGQKNKSSAPVTLET